jgi:hypothetical protein
LYDCFWSLYVGFFKVATGDFVAEYICFLGRGLYGAGAFFTSGSAYTGFGGSRYTGPGAGGAFMNTGFGESAE